MPIISPFKTDIPRYPCRVMHRGELRSQKWYQKLIEELIVSPYQPSALFIQLKTKHSFDDIEIMHVAIELSTRLHRQLSELQDDIFYD